MGNEKIYFDFELPYDGVKTGIWFTKTLTPQYGNEPFNDLIGYSAKITAYDRSGKVVNHDFLHGAEIIKAYTSDGVSGDITEGWKKRLLNFLQQRRILGIREVDGQTIYDPYLSETIVEDKEGKETDYIDVKPQEDSRLIEIYKYICPECKYPLMRHILKTTKDDFVECTNHNCSFDEGYSDKYIGIPMAREE